MTIGLHQDPTNTISLLPLLSAGLLFDDSGRYCSLCEVGAAQVTSLLVVMVTVRMSYLVTSDRVQKNRRSTQDLKSSSCWGHREAGRPLDRSAQVGRNI